MTDIINRNATRSELKISVKKNEDSALLYMVLYPGVSSSGRPAMQRNRKKKHTRMKMCHLIMNELVDVPSSSEKRTEMA